MNSDVNLNGARAGAAGPVLCGSVFEYPRDRCVHELFEEQVRRTPEAVAVEMSGQGLTYRALNDKANQLARHLQTLGVGRGTLVGVCLDRSLDAVVAIYGVLKAGGAYVPLDPAYPRERLAYMVESAGLRVLITANDASLPTGVDGVAVVRMDSDAPALAGQSGANLGGIATPEDLIYVIFTSGSTGQPKAAGVYHRGFANLLHWFLREFEIGNADRVLLVSSLSFDLTQKNLYAPLLRGGTLHLLPPGPYDVSRLARRVEQHGITLLNCTPSAFYPLIEPPDAETFRRVQTLRVVFLGGEPISVLRVRTWLEHASCRAEIANTYGPTECTDICGFYRLNRQNLDRFPFVPLGYAVDNVQLAIVDEQQQLVAAGVAGELWVGGAGVGAGYVNDATMTAGRFVANPFPAIQSERVYRTGDQVRLHPDGVIEFLGRLDHQVKIRGFRIELHEIEAAMDRHPDVREAVVVVHRATPEADPRLVCYFTAHTSPAPEATVLRQFVAGRLPEYMIPGAIKSLPVFPLSPNGKVDRRALERLALEMPVVSGGLAGVAPGLEADIRVIWQEVLGLGEVGVNQNFFDLGGSSIQLAQVHDRVQKLVRREVPLTDLFAHTTIRALAVHCGSSATVQPASTQIQDRARRQREAMAQRRPSRS